MPTEAETAWLAGLLEGEGSFAMIKCHVGGKVYRYPKIVVNMTDRDIISRVADLFGGSVYDMPRYIEGRKAQYRAQITGSGAARWMQDLYPWLGERRRTRIDAVLTEYLGQEPTRVRRRRSCSEAAANRLRSTTSGQFMAAELPTD
ncbi:hypothetical protein ACFVH4_05135 [Nocardia ignorata]|uniref:hypothetical protein n=1 Tax=Nocardia ignorata TaxID=145285 RepID=UPI00362FE51C